MNEGTARLIKFLEAEIREADSIRRHYPAVADARSGMIEGHRNTLVHLAASFDMTETAEAMDLYRLLDALPRAWSNHR